MSLYPLPKDIPTEVFARVPEKLRRAGGRPAWGGANRPGHDIDCFLEGPTFDKSGNLYVVNIPYGEIFKISPSGDFSIIAEYDGWPNGMKVDEKGYLIIADYKKGIIPVSYTHLTLPTIHLV